MGELVGVRKSNTSSPGVVRYELNRNLTGMGHERYTSVREIVADSPASRLSRDLLSTGQVASVHTYQNMVTVEVEAGFSADGLDEVIADMYTYWKPGVEPPTFDDQPDEADGGAAELGDGVDPAFAEAAKKVPIHLLERAKAARERWNAKSG